MFRIEIQLYGQTQIDVSTPEDPKATMPGNEVLIAGLAAHGDKAFIKSVAESFGMAVDEVEAF